MTQEEKQLLLVDICGRLPYGVKVHIEHDVFYDEIEPYDSILTFKTLDDFLRMERLEVKPFLRPMGLMTEEEKKEFINASGYEIHESINGRHYEYYLQDYVGTKEEPLANADSIDWLNAHHFDYRGLIEKGLALKAPDYMY